MKINATTLYIRSGPWPYAIDNNQLLKQEAIVNCKHSQCQVQHFGIHHILSKSTIVSCYRMLLCGIIDRFVTLWLCVKLNCHLNGTHSDCPAKRFGRYFSCPCHQSFSFDTVWGFVMEMLFWLITLRFWGSLLEAGISSADYGVYIIASRNIDMNSSTSDMSLSYRQSCMLSFLVFVNNSPLLVLCCLNKKARRLFLKFSPTWKYFLPLNKVNFIMVCLFRWKVLKRDVFKVKVMLK